MTERIFALPASFEGHSVQGLSRCADYFQEHLVQLEKEAFCLKVRELFEDAPDVEAIAFAVDVQVGESEYAPHWPLLRYRLEVDLSWRTEGDSEDPTLGWAGETDLRQLQQECFSRHLARFCHGLTLTRLDLIGAEAGSTMAEVVERLERRPH